MQNSYHVLGNKFDNLYLHAKSQVKRKKTWRKFDRLYFYAKSKIKSKKYPKVKFHTSLKRCGHAESKF